MLLTGGGGGGGSSKYSGTKRAQWHFAQLLAPGIEFWRPGYKKPATNGDWTEPSSRVPRPALENYLLQISHSLLSALARQ